MISYDQVIRQHEVEVSILSERTWREFAIPLIGLALGILVTYVMLPVFSRGVEGLFAILVVVLLWVSLALHAFARGKWSVAGPLAFILMLVFVFAGLRMSRPPEDTVLSVVFAGAIIALLILFFYSSYSSVRETQGDHPCKVRMTYHGPESYTRAFLGSGCAVVLEDDGQRGFFYAAREDFEEIFDALLLYEHGESDQLKDGEKFMFVWNPSRRKAGIYYRGEYQAIVDFSSKRACNRKCEPPTVVGPLWPHTSHEWNEEMEEGLVVA